MRITTTIMLLTTTAVLACAQVASAATDEAWAKLFADAQKACHAETRLVGARTRGKPVDFEAFVLVAVDGRYPQPQLKNKPALFYCLYDKKTGKAEANEAPAR